MAMATVPISSKTASPFSGPRNQTHAVPMDRYKLDDHFGSQVSRLQWGTTARLNTEVRSFGVT